MYTYWLYDPFVDFNRLFNDASTHGCSAAQRRSHDHGDNAVRIMRPRMDLHENAQNNTVTATFELPGVSKENVNIDVHNGRLTISAENKLSSEQDENGYAVRERRYGKFSRTLQLPQGIQDSEIEAAMDHGVLTVTFPKTGPELAPNKIQIA